MAQILLSGRHVLGAGDYNERLLQRILVQGQKAMPQAIAMGSSRMLLASEALNPGSFFNHAMSGATLEDDLALFELYESKWHRTPPKVWLGLDPWLLNRNNDQSRWEYLGDEYGRMSSKLGLNVRVKSSQNAPSLELLSLAYLSQSLRVLKREGMAGLTQRHQAEATATLAHPEALKRSDGAIRYPANVRERSPDAVDGLARNEAQAEPIYSLGRFEELDPQARRQLEALLQHLKRGGSRVVLFLAPYHPIVYRKLASDPHYARVAQAESWYRDLAARNQLTLLGSFDPQQAACKGADFYDGKHPTEACTHRLLADTKESSVRSGKGLAGLPPPRVSVEGVAR